MQRALTLHRSTVGQKAIMAVSGVVLFGFVIAHLLGNLQIFLGAQVMHDYAVSLRTVPAVLWAMRAALLVAVVAHVAAAVALANRNGRARPVEYKKARVDRVTSYAARTMLWSGPILAMYIVYHLLHLTFGFGPGYDHQNPYNNVVYGFSDWRIATVYIVANALLGLHLWHGAWSWFQSLGLNHPRYNAMRRALATAIALFITAGNVGIPSAVLAGVVEPTTERFCAPELATVEGECDGFVQ